MAGYSAVIGYYGRRLFHSEQMLRPGHWGNQDISFVHFINILGRGDYFDFSNRPAKRGRHPAYFFYIINVNFADYAEKITSLFSNRYAGHFPILICKQTRLYPLFQIGDIWPPASDNLNYFAGMAIAQKIKINLLSS